MVGSLENKRPRHGGGAAASGALLVDAIFEPRTDALAKVGNTVPVAALMAAFCSSVSLSEIFSGMVPSWLGSACAQDESRA